MAYTPIGWQTGDTITAEKLNKMDNGWSVTNGSTLIVNQTVTTEDDDGDNVAHLDISGGSATITADTIRVTFDGTEYTCTKNGETYGGTGFDFSVYPFMLYDDGTLYTESAGTYTVKIESIESSVEISASFAKAVADVLPFLHIVEGETTWQKVYDTLANMAIAVYIYNDPDGCTIYFATSAYEANGTYYVTMASVYQSQASVSVRKLATLSANGTLEPAL